MSIDKSTDSKIILNKQNSSVIKDKFDLKSPKIINFKNKKFEEQNYNTNYEKLTSLQLTNQGDTNEKVILMKQYNTNKEIYIEDGNL